MSLPIFLPCAAGVEHLLLAEVQRLLPSCKDVRAARGGVSLVGGVAEVMLLNLELRLAQRVLVQVASSGYESERDLYQLARSVDWTQWISPDQTLRVNATAQHSPLKSLAYAALCIKDSVCDAFREIQGCRPNVDKRNPDLPLVLHLQTEHASLYVDTSGDSLFKRGWRQDKGDAPLKETLAAAMLMAANWQGTAEHGGALHDPCCGSGTIVIEAAQIASRIAPGINRSFAFERMAPFTTAKALDLWKEFKNSAQKRVVAPVVPISASDISFRMIDFARRNAQRAGVAQWIDFHGGDALERPPPSVPGQLQGTLMLNPPYGERITNLGASKGGENFEDFSLDDQTQPIIQSAKHEQSSSNDLDFFPRLASHLKLKYAPHPAGWTAFILSPDMKLPSAMRMRESQRIPMWNGPIECRLFRFDLYPKTRKSTHLIF